MSGHGHKVGLELSHIKGQMAGCLRSIYQTERAVGVAELDDLGYGLNTPGHVGNVIDHDKAGIGAQDTCDVLGMDASILPGRDQAQADLPPFFQGVQRAQHGIMLVIGGDHVIPCAQYPADSGIQRICTVQAKDDLERIGRVEVLGKGLACLHHQAAGGDGEPVAAAAGVGAAIVHGVGHGAYYRIRLWKTGGRIVEIDHKGSPFTV